MVDELTQKAPVADMAAQKTQRWLTMAQERQKLLMVLFMAAWWSFLHGQQQHNVVWDQARQCSGCFGFGSTIFDDAKVVDGGSEEVVGMVYAMRHRCGL